MRGIRQRGKTVFLTTHLMEEAERLCDRVAILDHGRIIDIGTPAELVRRHCPERTVIVATEDPTAQVRFRAIPQVESVSSLIFYPMIGLCGLFVPVGSLPPVLRAIARALPPTYAVSLLRGIWHGDGWSAHAGDVAILTLMFLSCTAVSARVFRWE